MENHYLKFYRKCAQPFVDAVEEVSWITPNRITYFRLVGNIPVFYCFYKGGVYYYIIGAILNEILFLFDCMDGQLARQRDMSSQFGHWMEVLGDRLYTSAGGIFGFFVAFGVWRETNDIFIWIVLFFIVFGKNADRAIVSMNSEEKFENSMMDGLREENVKFKQKRMYKISSWFIDLWMHEIVILCALFYYPLSMILTVHPLVIGMVISAILVQANWMARIFVSLRFFIKNKAI